MTDTAGSAATTHTAGGADESVSVRHNEAKARYEIFVGDELAGFTDAHASGDLVSFPHTEVDERFQGRGLASTLIEQALDDVRSKGKTIRTSCPFVRDFLDKHADYRDLLTA